MARYLIKDFEALSGIKAHTIRIWEQRYGILKPRRSDTNIRHYNDEELKALLNISLLNQNGYKISKVAKMGMSEIAEKVKNITVMSFDYPNQINALTRAMVEMNEMEFEKVLNVNIAQLGFEFAIENIVFPFLHQIGVMWQTGSINPAQEHFTSNLVRQKMIVNIDLLRRTQANVAAKSLLFLPEGEFHELSLLYFDYQLRKHHHHIMYLGQNVPMMDIEMVAESFKPDLAFSVITQRPAEKHLQDYVTTLSKSLPKTKIFLTGYRVLQSKKLHLPKNIRLLQNAGEIHSVVRGFKF